MSAVAVRVTAIVAYTHVTLTTVAHSDSLLLNSAFAAAEELRSDLAREIEAHTATKAALQQRVEGE